MKPTDVKKAIRVAMAAKQPIFIWGAPGVGKSSVVKQIAEEDGLELIDLRAVLLDAVDFGFPYVDTKAKKPTTYWATPSFLPTKGKGILFIDELPQAAPMVQNSLSQLILDKKLRDYYTLPEGWQIVAAGNRDKDRAATNRMPSHMANRFVHLDFEVDHEDFIRWAIDNGVRTEIIMFLKFRPELLHNFDPTRNEKAFPTPRSWEFVSKLMDANPPNEVLYDMIKGTVGEGAAAEFCGFLAIFKKLPSPDRILADPEHADVPTDSSVLAALCSALSRKTSLNTVDRLVKYAKRIPAEFSVLMVELCRRQEPEIVSTRSYIDWESALAKVRV